MQVHGGHDTHDDFGVQGWPSYPFKASTWQGRIDWCDAQLKDHPGARRMSYDQWHWQDRASLDQFLVIYGLKFS